MSWRLLLLLIIPLYFFGLALKSIKRGWIQHGWRGKNQHFHRHGDPWMFWFLTSNLVALSIMISCGIIIASLSQTKP
jgi:hypothetical protein